MTNFPALFQRATGVPPRPWQQELAADTTPLDRAIRVPTGYGKTLGVGLTWLFHRVIRADLTWPTRLVWVLPMRTLVEQTMGALHTALHKLGLDEDVKVHALMGGVDDGHWHLHPERPSILVGTQDMILSRALNRGYGLARARWPMDFGGITHDALWVLDEVQLMGVGFATALQLAVFRAAAPALRPSYTWSMSATLQPGWFSRSPDTVQYAAALPSTELTAADHANPLWLSTSKPITMLEAGLKTNKLADQIVGAHTQTGQAGPCTTLVVCNTVERAKDLHAEITRLKQARGIEIWLMHSRFRGVEREVWRSVLSTGTPDPHGRIIVATQVIEAGVDLSADLLFTELCPFASLVQRLGRLARRGGTGQAFVIPLDPQRLAAPYDSDALEASRLALAHLKDGSARSLSEFEASHPHLLDDLFAYDPPHFILEEEIHELFDTAADLSGGDVDVSRYIREGDERDLSVAWVMTTRDIKGRPLPPDPRMRPRRESLCAVPYFTARDWLCGKGSKGNEPRRLREGHHAWVWDYADGAYRTVERADLRPGAVIVVDATCGGYDPARGFEPDKKDTVAASPWAEADPQERADSTWDDDTLSTYPYQTIAFHGGAVARQTRAMAQALGMSPASVEVRCLDLAARWHDLGKSHEAFQSAIAGPARPARHDLAKAPRETWRTGANAYRTNTGPRPGFRHELASALALFDVLVRHPSPSQSALSATPPNQLELEILALPPEEFDLVVFLVCAHHGKLRARLHMGPKDPLRESGPSPIRGVHEGDELPPTRLESQSGDLVELPVSRLTLEPAMLGLSKLTGRSWTDRVERLRERHGPFRLAWLEGLLRAADVRASMATDLIDPAFSKEQVA